MGTKRSQTLKMRIMKKAKETTARRKIYVVMNKPTVYIIYNSNSPFPQTYFQFVQPPWVIVGNSFLSGVIIETLLAN